MTHPSTSLRHVASCGVLLLCLAMAAGPARLAAQGTTRTPVVTDPLVEARTMYDARVDARTVVGTMRRTHQRSLAETASIMRTVGFQSRDVVTALRAEYAPTASQLYSTMQQAGFAQATLAGAFEAAEVHLDCIDPQGFPIPCGSFGGTPDTPAMGQLSWTPKGEGETEGLLTITGSNIPPLHVKHGFNTLTQVSASASSVVVRFPPSASVGDLKVIRKSDNAVGLLETGYRVVKPPVPWPSFALVAIEAASSEASHWLGGARIEKLLCIVNGPLAVGVPGVLVSDNGFQGRIKQALTLAGAPAAVAQAWDDAFKAAWMSWASQVTIPALPLFPALAAFAGPEAPPIASVSVPLGAFVSTGLPQMQTMGLRARLLGALAPVSADEPARNAAAQTFAGVIGGKFDAMLVKAMVAKVMGGGPVPKYAPPNIPAAPVQGGSCSGTGIIAPQYAVF